MKKLQNQNHKGKFFQTIISWYIVIIFILIWHGYYYWHTNSRFNKIQTNLTDCKKDTQKNYKKMNSQLDKLDFKLNEIKDILTQIDITKEE